MADLSRIVKAYDVRGVVPEEFDVATARALGSAFARYVGSDAKPRTLIEVQVQYFVYPQVYVDNPDENMRIERATKVMLTLTSPFIHPAGNDIMTTRHLQSRNTKW